jgi:hypothetical protein
MDPKHKYIVSVREVFSRAITVESNSYEEAKEQANRILESGDTLDDDLSYEYTLDVDEWQVEQVD